MNSLPLITVGVPTYNRPEGLKKTLECLKEQTYKNLKIIISDNASDEKELIRQIVDKARIEDSRIEYIRHDKNMGAIKNLYYLLKKADTDFFMWAADDDEFEPTFIEEMYNALKSNDKAVVSITGVKVTDIMGTSSNTITLTPFLSKLSGDSIYKRFYNYIKQPVEQGRARILWGLCRREQLLSAVNDVINQSNKDEILWIDFPVDLQLLKYGDVIVVPKELFHVFLLPTSDGLREGNLFNSKEIEMCKRSYSAYIKVVENSSLSNYEQKELISLLSSQERKDLIKIVPFYFIKKHAPWLARVIKKLYFKFFVNSK